MDNPKIMDPVYQSTAAQGFIGIGWYDSGARNFYMSKSPIKSIEDLRGKKSASCRATRLFRHLNSWEHLPLQ